MDELEPLYAMLTAPFEGYYTAEGVNGPFLSGEQVASRLNAVLGVGNWMFHVAHQEFNPDTDDVIVLGEMRAWLNGQWVIRQQFGGQKVKRNRSTGMPNNMGDEYKGAATDAMKKCASLLGVGLYLMVSSATWHQGIPDSTAARTAARTAPVRSAGRPASHTARPDGPEPPQTAPRVMSGRTYRCHECERPLEAVTFPPKDGKPAVTWSANKLRYMSLRHHGMMLCIECYRKAVALLRSNGADAQAQATG